MTASTPKARKKSAQNSNAIAEFWQKNKDNILPPIIGVLGFLILWEIISTLPGMRLPGPTSLWTDERTRTLLLYPFYDRGGLDKGLFWQTMPFCLGVQSLIMFTWLWMQFTPRSPRQKKERSSAII